MREAMSLGSISEILMCVFISTIQHMIYEARDEECNLAWSNIALEILHGMNSAGPALGYHQLFLIVPGQTVD